MTGGPLMKRWPPNEYAARGKACQCACQMHLVWPVREEAGNPGARCQASCHATHDRGLSTAKDTVNHQPDMTVPGRPAHPPGPGLSTRVPCRQPCLDPGGPMG